MIRRLTLEASSVGEAARSIIASSRSGCTQGVYRGAVNIMLTRGLVSLVPELSERGPLNLTIMAPRSSGMRDLGFEVDEPVRVEGGNLLVGDRLAVDLSAAATHSEAPQALRTVGMAALRRNLRAAREAGLKRGRHEGIGGLLSAHIGEMAASSAAGQGVFAAAAAHRIDQLVFAVRKDDWQTLDRTVRRMVGLGVGLTPSCDDFLAGMAIFTSFYSASSGTLAETSRAIARAISDHVEMTTPLSEAYLRQAARGRGNQRVMALCRALLTSGPHSAAEATERLMTVGETSGTDTLLGVLVAGEICVELDNRSGAQW